MASRCVLALVALLAVASLAAASRVAVNRNLAFARAALLEMRCGQPNPPNVCRCGMPRSNAGCASQTAPGASAASSTSTPSRHSFEAATLEDDTKPAAPAASTTVTPAPPAPAPAASATVKKQKSKVKPVYLYDDDDDNSNGSPHVTVIHNANELNDGFNKHGVFGNGGNGGNGGGDGNGNGGGNGGGDSSCGNNGRGTCSAFWKANGCVRPRVPNARAKCTHCSANFNCEDLCCENPPIYGNCANFWQNKGCPSKTHFPLKQNAQVSCGVEAVCFGRCCKHKPFACEHFWEKSDCPRETHVRKSGAQSSECDPESVHCLEQCCEPQEIQCDTFFRVNGGCPAGYRIDHDKLNVRCRDAFSHGEACWKRCCDSVPLGDGRCSYWGDPHVISFDNRRYNCFTPGEYEMFRNPEKQESVHNIQTKHPDPNLQHVPPLNTGMAFRAKDDVLIVELVAPAWATFQVNVRYNGKLMPYPKFKVKYGPFILTPIGVLPEPNAPWTAFGTDPMISVKNTLSGTGVIVHFQNTGFGMRHFNIEVAFPNRATKGQLHTTGLCGTWNGNPNDDYCGKANEDDCCKNFLVPRDQTLFPQAPAQGGPADTKATPETVCKTSSRLHDAHQACQAVTGLKEDCVMEFCSGEGKSSATQLAHEIKQVITGK